MTRDGDKCGDRLGTVGSGRAFRNPTFVHFSLSKIEGRTQGMLEFSNYLKYHLIKGK